MELQDKKYWIWLSLIRGIGNKKKQMLLERYETPERIYNLNSKEVTNIKELAKEAINNILDKNIRNKIENHIEYMQKNNIELITIKDKEYPAKLKNIYDPPIVLYIKGDINILDNRSIAIIGCRDASEYGINSAKYFSYNLAKKGVNIVSGLAKGIDSYAHIGAINAKGNTIAIIGNGLDSVYPKENIEIARKILETGGSIITEYPLGTKPEKMNFPARNRIISGISNSVIVVEAKAKSGTLITVDFALEQGRDVYVVPGNINSINSIGTNELLKQGAKPVTNYFDIDL